MVKHYNGPDRRIPTQDGHEGRRPADQHCGLHDVLWSHHDTEKDQYRVTTCGKISALKLELDKMVQWKTFAFIFTFSVLVAGAGFGFFGAQIGKLSDKQSDGIELIRDKQEEGMSSIKNSLSLLKENQAVMSSVIKSNQEAVINEIEVLKRRQDILRDLNIQQRKDDGRDGRDGKVGRDGRDAPK